MTRPKLRELFRLMRPTLAPTAAADVITAGVLAGAPLLPLTAAALGSTALYTAGMVQNDLFDRERDQRLFPDRPLVLDPGLVGVARLLCVAGFGLGLALCWFAGALWPALAVVVLASAYNGGVKRHFPWDTITMDGARAFNLAIGMAVGGAELTVDAPAYLAAYLLFIAGVTAASRAEDMEPRETRRLALLLALLPQLLALGAFASQADQPALFLLPGVYLTLLFLRAFWRGSREGAMQYVLGALLGIYLIHSVTLWTTGKEFAVVPILGCAALSFFLLGMARAARSKD